LLTIFGNQYLWFEGDKLFIGDAVKGKLDSVKIRPEDFVDTGRTIYLTLDENNSTGYLMFGGLLLIGGMFWLIRGRSKRIPRQPTAVTGSVVEHQPPDLIQTEAPINDPVACVDAPEASSVSHMQGIDPFDAVERSLLALLFDNDVTLQKRTSTQEVNRILGVGNKTLDMQKRKRSDVIRAVNRKFQLIHPDRSADLIMKNRSDMDGRLSEYYLNPAELTFIKTYLD
jgi:hypothetical protein